MAAIHFSRSPSPREELYFESCNLDLVVELLPSDHYLPPPVLRRWLDSYEEGEVDQILADFKAIGTQKFQNSVERKEILFTASAPMGGGSFALESFLGGGECPDSKFAASKQGWIYIDPMRECLPRMQHTYIEDRGRGKSPEEASQKWGMGAGFISEIYLALALQKGYAIADGWTMGSLHSKKGVDMIQHRYQYTTSLIHVSCHETVRRQSWDRREASRWDEKAFYDKSEEFYALLGYFVASMEKIYFCYRDEQNQTRWAAKLEWKELTIYDDEAFKAIERLHAPELWESAIGPIGKIGG